jgi:hypothetical protein
MSYKYRWATQIVLYKVNTKKSITCLYTSNRLENVIKEKQNNIYNTIREYEGFRDTS